MWATALGSRGKTSAAGAWWPEQGQARQRLERKVMRSSLQGTHGGQVAGGSQPLPGCPQLRYCSQQAFQGRNSSEEVAVALVVPPDAVPRELTDLDLHATGRKQGKGGSNDDGMQGWTRAPPAPSSLVHAPRPSATAAELPSTPHQCSSSSCCWCPAASRTHCGATLARTSSLLRSMGLKAPAAWRSRYADCSLPKISRRILV